MGRKQPSKTKYVVDGVELDAGAREAVTQFNHETDIPIKAIVRRVLKWFVAQPRPVQAVVMGWPEGMTAEAYAAALERMAAAVRLLASDVSREDLRKASRGSSPPAAGATTPWVGD